MADKTENKRTLKWFVRAFFAFWLVFFPQWFQSAFGLFTTEAFFPWLQKKGWLKMPNLPFSPYWITGSLALLLLVWFAILDWRRFKKLQVATPSAAASQIVQPEIYDGSSLFILHVCSNCGHGFKIVNPFQGNSELLYPHPRAAMVTCPRKECKQIDAITPNYLKPY